MSGPVFPDHANPAATEKSIMTHHKNITSPRAVSAPPSTRACGRDGRNVEIPRGFIANQGRDGRMVAIPAGSGYLEGEDGRLVVIPSGFIGIENAKGRVVPKAR